MTKEIRSLKIASVLHRAISRVLMEEKIFRQIVVISEVKLSKDMSKADVYIVLSSLNTVNSEHSSFLAQECSEKFEDDIDSFISEINQSAWFIRKSISKHVQLRFIPELVFKPDLAFDNFVNVNKILHNNIN